MAFTRMTSFSTHAVNDLRLTRRLKVCTWKRLSTWPAELDIVSLSLSVNRPTLAAPPRVIQGIRSAVKLLLTNTEGLPPLPTNCTFTRHKGKSGAWAPEGEERWLRGTQRRGRERDDVFKTTQGRGTRVTPPLV